MKETQQTRVVLAADLLYEVKRLSDRGARMIQLGCTQDGEVFELNYSFDIDGGFENIRVCTNGNEVIPSVSNIYLCSFIYENEIHDLYGITFEGIAVDYKGTLIKTAKLHPFRMDPTEMKKTVKGKGKLQAKTLKEEVPSESVPEQTADQEIQTDATGEVFKAVESIEGRGNIETVEKEEDREDKKEAE
jgi:ech hydrogenase subunit D